MIAARSRFRSESADPFPLSRTKLQLFTECPRCFYLDRRCGVTRPDDAYYSLNLAVDLLLKREFDVYRLRGDPHPVMQMFGIDAVPFRYKDLSMWRDTPTGIRFLHQRSGFEVFGIVDDLWQHADGSIAVVDYKATSTQAPLTLEGREGYMRQLECYQWLLRQCGFNVSPIAYILYANASRDRETFDRKLEFAYSILPHEGNVTWVEDALIAAKECLMMDIPPAATADCAWCMYRRKADQASEGH